MNFFYNCIPPGYEGDREILTVELPSSIMETVLKYARDIAYEQNTNSSKVLNDIVTESVNTISQKNYVRKNRKTKKR